MGRHLNRQHAAPQRVQARQRPLSRRRVVAGALAVAGSAAMGAGLSGVIGPVAAQNFGLAFAEPDVVESKHGLLTATLSAARDLTRDPGALAYMGAGADFGGAVPGPTLRAAPGDRIKVRLENALGEPTNLHFHGLHVSPLGHSDNVFVDVQTGGGFDYDLQIPGNHPSGLFWYHPHRHHLAQKQVKAGLAGAIVIAGGADEPPELRDVAAERLLVLQRIDPPLVKDEAAYVNGLARPVIDIAQDTKQLWRIVNASANAFFNLWVEGHQVRRVGVDGNWLRDYLDFPAVNVIPLGPAERAEVFVTGGAVGAHQIWALRKGGVLAAPFFEEDFTAQFQAEFVAASHDRVATLRVTPPSAPAEEAAAIVATPAAPVPFTDLRAIAEPRKRDIVFQFAPRTSTFVIDGRTFNPNRIDQTVNVGAVEEWRLLSETEDFHGWHPFHLHVNDFDVINTSHAGIQPAFYQDTAPLPPATRPAGAPPREAPEPGWLEMRSTFADFTGKFPYHCHLLDHEDNSMMGVVEVVRPVRIVAAALDPASCSVTVDSTVLWTNEGPQPAILTADDGSFDSGPLARGQSFAYTFERPETVAYRCVHGEGGGAIETTGAVIVDAVRTIDIADGALHPVQIDDLVAGTTVIWTNRAAAPFAATVSGPGAAPSFAFGPLAQGESFAHTFSAVGDVRYAGGGAAPLAGGIKVGSRPAGGALWITTAGFAPLTVPVGTTVTWTNRSGAAQTVTSLDLADGAPLFDSGRLDAEEPFLPGQRFSHRFLNAHTHAYFSKLAMAGTIEITAEPLGPSAPIQIVDGEFVPAHVVIRAGTPVTWENRTGAAVTITADDNSFNEVAPPGGTVTRTVGGLFGTLGYCNPLAMRGTIDVV